MRKFQVKVNGQCYEVEVEELTGTQSVVETPPTTQVMPQKTQHEKHVEGTRVVAPMPGKIVEIKVSLQQQVKEGDLIAVLEAMKMENEIFASANGTIASLPITQGSMVESNDLIAVIN